MANYFDHMLQLSRHVAHALALSLHLQGDFFTNRMTDPVAQLVTFKYPPEEKDEAGSKQISCGEHTDCGFLTLLVQTAPGLEVYSKVTQTWHSIEPVENAVLVNLGDLTQFWTKGKYKSTPHRVHNRSRDGTNRYSLVFFANCDFDARLDDLDSTTGRDHTNSNCEASPGGGEQQHQNENDDAVVTAGEYILEKLGLMWLMNKDK
jgi:isopenicillin N synthase-like dioxygenase